MATHLFGAKHKVGTVQESVPPALMQQQPRLHEPPHGAVPDELLLDALLVLDELREAPDELLLDELLLVVLPDELLLEA